MKVNTKYKTVAKNVKLGATQLPPNTLEHITQATKEPSRKDTRRICHKFMHKFLGKLKIGRRDFLTEAERLKFLEMLLKHSKVFALTFDKIGCIDPVVVAPMVIFTIPYLP